MQSTIRPARPADGPHLRRLQSLLPEPTPALLSAAIPTEQPSVGDPAAGEFSVPPTADEVSVPPTADEISVSSAAAFTLLVTVDEQDVPVGYLLALGGEATHIAELVVDPDFRRAGRGQALLEAVIARGTTPLTVHVAADNDAARRLYECVGFTEISRSADRFERDDALTLRYDPAAGEQN